MASVKIETEMNADAARDLFKWGAAVADIIVKFDDYKVRLGDLTVAGVHYLAGNGFNQSMADSTAGLESGKMSVPAARDEADGKRWAKFIAEAKLPADADVATVTEAVVRSRQTKRYDAIVASAILAKDGGAGGRMSPKDAWTYKTALDEVNAKHAAAGKEPPKGPALKALVAKYAVAKADYFARLWQEREARLATAAETTDEILGF
jgi:hypothetical protein